MSQINLVKLVVISISLIVFQPNFAQENFLKNEHSEDVSSAALLNVNASQYGTKYRETVVLMQNRMGVRIEYTLDRNNLQLWISPQFRNSDSYVDRNWSNRDDHTNIFNRILIPGCDLGAFIKCDWDPFHSILYFEDQTLHIAQIYDQPAVLVWFEKDGLIDIKTYGKEAERTDKSFIINFTDRERDFQSAAILGKGEGYFQHQLELDKYRSIYTRAHMKPQQVLLIASELEKENIGRLAKKWIGQPVDQLLSNNEVQIEQALSSGQFKFKDRPEMQKLLDKSRRAMLSLADHKGFMRSTNQYIYHLMWYRDAGMNSGHTTYSGLSGIPYNSTRIALKNPNFTNTAPEAIFFGQMQGGPITKWQEDGLFYLVWPAFAHWTQTGDKSLCEGKNLETMERALTWLEHYCYDEEKGLFGRYFACETPMTGSRDDGWDNATGAPTFKWGSAYEGHTITRTYDNYINLLHYSTYLMLSAMQEDQQKADLYYKKAMRLGENIKAFFDYENVRPTYGFLETQNKEMIVAKPYGMDIWDYVWGLSIPPFEPLMPEKYRDLREALRTDMTTTDVGYFHCVYFALLTSMDTEFHSQDSIITAMDKLVPYSCEPGKYLPMPYAMPEMFNISEENPFHDIRPLVYSIAPWLSAVSNLALHRLPFGIAARGNKFLEQLENYDYKGGQLDVTFTGNGPTSGIIMNGETIKHTLQIPDNKVKPGKNALIVQMSEQDKVTNLLTGSTVQLMEVKETRKRVEFHINAYGQNVLTFRGLSGKIKVFSEAGEPQKISTQKMGQHTFIEFSGRGKFIVSI